MGVDPYGRNVGTTTAVSVTLHFVVEAFRRGLRSGSIRGLLYGAQHFIHAAGATTVFRNPQVRMLLNGIHRLESPVIRKAPVTVDLLDACYSTLSPTSQDDRMLWGVLSVAFFFLLRRSEIAASGKTFQWFALTDEDVTILDMHGSSTLLPAQAQSVQIRLRGSKTNQNGTPTVRLLSRSGHAYICPVFGALCLKRYRGPLSSALPIAAYATTRGEQRAVSAARITYTIRHAAQSLGMRCADYATHSLRSGGATQMYRRGVDALTIQFHGRWISDTYKIYTRMNDDVSASIASSMMATTGGQQGN